MIKNNQTYYYHTDGLGSIIAITDSAGQVVQRYEYDSFGAITYIQDSTFKQSYTYTGREYDEESGLYYYRARYYDAKVGRFITPDPSLTLSGNPNISFLLHKQLKNPQELNPFSYVGNEPINYIDPLGLDRYEWCGGEDNVSCKCLSDWACGMFPPEVCCKSEFVDCMAKAQTQKEQEVCAFEYATCLAQL